MIIEPRVGHADGEEGVELKGGMYAMSAMPVALKSSAQVVTFIPSGLVNKMVSTTINFEQRDRGPSKGFASNHVLTLDKYEVRAPPSYLQSARNIEEYNSAHDVWQSSMLFEVEITALWP